MLGFSFQIGKGVAGLTNIYFDGDRWGYQYGGFNEEYPMVIRACVFSHADIIEPG